MPPVVVPHVQGRYNVADSYDNWDEWAANTSYAVGDKVKRINGQTVTAYICKTANSDSSFNSTKWTNQFGKMNYAEIVGNGTANDARSNARTLDWDGNERLMGDIYVGCNADSTGGTKLTAPVAMTGADGTNAGTSGYVPAPAATDNTKYLKGNGTWADVDALPAVTSSDNGKSLEVVDGDWTIGAEKISTHYKANDGLNGSLTPKTWNGFTNIIGYCVWTDGDNIYYSYTSGTTSNQYVLNKATSTWSEKTWNGYTSIYGENVWTDGENIYFSGNANQYVLDKSTSTWIEKTWTGLTSSFGRHVWTDGDNIYYSNNANQYVLNKATSTWSEKTWSGLTSFNGDKIWTDGNNIYYSNNANQYVLNKSNDTWSSKTWTGLTSFNKDYIWTDGTDIYYCNGSNKYVLNKSTSTWSSKTWSGLSSLYGDRVWTDGDDYYFSDGNSQYIFGKTYEDKILFGSNGEFNAQPASDLFNKFINKKYKIDATNLSTKTWEGLTSFYGQYIWTDGENVYCSHDTNHYVLNKSTYTWSVKTWTGLSSFYAQSIWTDGENYYYSNSNNQYVLDKSTSTWSAKVWNGLTSIDGDYVWTDGNNVYYSDGSTQYALNKSTSTWSVKTWTGLTNFYGHSVWTDGENVYYSYGSNQYVLNKYTSTWYIKAWTGLGSFFGQYIWTDGYNVYYNYSSDQYVLDESTSTWSLKTWTGLTTFDGIYTWTDGENTYYSCGTDQYVIDIDHNSRILVGTNGEFSPVSSSGIILPSVSASDNGKVLRVVQGGWSAVQYPAANQLLPAPPMNDGTYFLQCSISSGSATYSWVNMTTWNGGSY